jgi:hypothetical protein
MSPTISEIAEAFSRHEFDRTFPHMDDDIEWTQIGEGHIRGKADVVTTCERSNEYDLCRRDRQQRCRLRPLDL